MPGRPANPVDTTTFAGRLGANIRARRLRRKLSTIACARAAGVSHSTWCRWETGDLPAMLHLDAIAAVLRCRPKDLLPE